MPTPPLSQTLTIYLILAGVGVVLLIFLSAVRARSSAERKALWLKYGVFNAVVVSFILAVYTGRVVFHAYILLITMVGLNEFFSVLEQKRAFRGKWLGLLMGLVVNLGFYLENRTWFYIITLLPLILILVSPVWGRGQRKPLDKITCTLLGVFLISFLLGHIILIRNAPYGVSTVIFAFAVIATNDSFAQLWGRLIGRHKLWPQISPNKTLEGAIGGLLSGALVCYFLPFPLPNPNPLYRVGAAIAVGIAGQLGDLVMSYFKREFDVKDFGHLLPQHGGVLDRFDSLILAAPIFYLYLSLG